MIDYRAESPQVLLDFLSYHETVKGHSQGTVDEYFLDLRSFFRYMKLRRGLVPADTEFDKITIQDIDIDFLRTVTLSEIYDYLSYLTRNGHLNNASRARKVSTLRSFFKFLSTKTHLLEDNPIEGLDMPKVKKDLPRYLTLDESIQLLESVDGKNQERDYCILTLFLNCGLRISELVSLNIKSVQDDTLRVLGKGNKVRMLYLNDACKMAIQDWLIVRSGMTLIDQEALFVTSHRTRITRAGVHKMVKKRLAEAGLDASLYSSHKLRHTAATLMLQNGVDVRALQEVLGHDHLNTTQIYTHIDNDDLRIAARANPLASVHKPASEPPKDSGDL